MRRGIDDLRVLEVKELAEPSTVAAEFPISDDGRRTVSSAREAIRAILRGDDSRLLVVVGPCSIHDPVAAEEYAHQLAVARAKHRGELELVMRVYFEKPRTTVGWKGLINDPGLDDSFDINRGLRVARRLLVNLNDIGVPAATEYLDMTVPQYISDLIAWGAIGARTTESQVHRELASGLSCPVGFKNGTDGNLRIAFEAVRAASHPHHFLGVTKEGHAAIIATSGNEDCHIILRGGRLPNYDSASIQNASGEAERAGLPSRVMVDASHGNSLKDARKQTKVAADLAAQVGSGSQHIFGVMLESNLIAGRQNIEPGKLLTYGQSITDACLGWTETEGVLDQLAEAVRRRRAEV